MNQTVICPECDCEFTHVPVQSSEPKTQLTSHIDLSHLFKMSQSAPPNNNAPVPTTLKLFYLMTLFGDEMTFLNNPPQIPPKLLQLMNNADLELIQHIVLYAVGRWDTLACKEVKKTK